MQPCQRIFKKISLTVLVACGALSGCVTNDISASTEYDKALANGAATFARFVPERDDDFAWENDVIAFRAFGPALRKDSVGSGIDCWLKRVPHPVINNWYDLALNKDTTYHQDNGEGLDNYHVGSSAGCGGTALWLNGERRGFNTFVNWEINSASPEKTVFTLFYKREIEGNEYQEHKRITVEVGKHLYQAESTFYKNGVLAANLPIAIGISTHNGKAKVDKNAEHQWLATWEQLPTKNADGTSEMFGLGTGIKLAEDSLPVGVQPKFIEIPASKNKADQDKAHALIVAKTNSQGKLGYYVGYGWQKAGAITSAEQWQQYLTKFSVSE